MKIFDPKLTGSIAFENAVQGNFEITGDLVVPGSITAREFKTEFVSASIIYQSGSSQFGDTIDDTHIFSGSVLINASGSTSPDLKIGPTFNFAGKNGEYLGQIGWNRNVTTGQIFDSNYTAHQIHNYQGNLNHQIYASNGNFVTAHSYDSTGNIGFGVGNGVTPRQKLDVRGKLIFGGTGTSYYGQPGNFDTSSNGDKIILYSDSGTSYNGTIGVGSVSNLWLKSQGESANEGRIDLYTGGSLSLRVDGNGHIGIGTTGIGAKLTFKNEVVDRKIALYTVVDNNYQFYGFGIADNTLMYHTAATSDDHVFYAGTSATTRSELARISGTGNLTVSGTTTTASPLTIQASSPYIQWKNSAGTRLGYIQHNETNLVMSVDTGDIVLDGRVGIGTNPSLSGVRLHTYNNSTDAYNIFESSANKWVFGEAGGVCQIGGLYGVHSGINVDTAGQVGIGVTSPTEKLTVNGNINFPFSTSGVVYFGIQPSPTNPFATNAKELVIRGANAYTAGTPTQAQAGGDVYIKAGLGIANTGLGVYAGDVSIEGGETHDANPAGAGKVIFKTSGIERARVDNLGTFQISETSANGYINTNGTDLEIDVNRHPETGVFSDTAKGHARIALRAEDSGAGSRIIFSTATANNTPGTERMRIHSSGAVTKPYTPAFLVDGSFAHTGGNWLLASSSYTRVKYNIGTHFNTTNGRFTAPVAGRYMFFAGGYSPVGTANKRYAYNVRINGGTIEHITGGTYTGDADSPMAAHSIVVNLNANDYVELYIFSIIAATIGNSSHEAYFGGYLLG